MIGGPLRTTGPWLLHHVPSVMLLAVVGLEFAQPGWLLLERADSAAFRALGAAHLVLSLAIGAAILQRRTRPVLAAVGGCVAVAAAQGTSPWLWEWNASYPASVDAFVLTDDPGTVVGDGTATG